LVRFKHFLDFNYVTLEGADFQCCSKFYFVIRDQVQKLWGWKKSRNLKV
jgi:hypothetical protein